MKKVLFIDRDGTLILEAPPSYQVDDFSKLAFYPDMFMWLKKMAAETDFEWVMVTNQDGLGTPSFPENSFWPVHHFIMNTLEQEGIRFSRVCIDRSLPEDHAPTRKPGTAMLSDYLGNPAYDLEGSFVIGDRITDVQLAANLGCKAIWLSNDPALGSGEIQGGRESLEKSIALETTNWKDIYSYLVNRTRLVKHSRKTHETSVTVILNPDGTGQTNIDTGLKFFDHMLDQLGRHSGADLSITTRGDLEVDEHHTIEDTAITLGEAYAKSLGDKKGTGRYGFTLPMDDALAQVALDFGGRSWLVWDVSFSREKIGDMPTEMFYHFFRSFSDAARCNINIKAEGENEHHKIESIFKALARALKTAMHRDPENRQLPSTKGML